MKQSKWAIYNSQILNIYRENPSTGWADAARIILGEDAEFKDVDTLRTYIKRYIGRQDENTVESTTSTSEEGYEDEVLQTDAFKKYCLKEGIDIKRVKSAKFVTHSGQQKFNVVLNYDEEIESVDWAEVKSLIKEELDDWHIDVPHGRGG